MLGARRPRAGPSKASASTLCQKCLKRDIYECNIAPQDRPYKSRPSRTQQLANPKLIPKLESDVPNDLLRKEGVADEALAKIRNDRAGSSPRKRPHRSASRSRSPTSRQHRRRRRSRSSSVSTISTNASRSSSGHAMQDIAYPSQRDSQVDGMLPGLSGKKRRRSSSAESSRSIETASSFDKHVAYALPVERLENRNTRRRRSSISPEGRGRSRDYSTDQAGGGRHRRHRRSHSGSMDRSKIARHRQSLTPEAEQRLKGKRDMGRLERKASDRKPESTRPVPRKDRSLSPFSKRVAMTRAMNAERM